MAGKGFFDVTLVPTMWFDEVGLGVWHEDLAGETADVLTAASGTFAISGTAASVLPAYKVSAESGALTLLGSTASLVWSGDSAPTAGSPTPFGHWTKWGTIV